MSARLLPSRLLLPCLLCGQARDARGLSHLGFDCRLVEEKGSGFRRAWRDSCVRNHSDWTYLYWDRESAQIFLDTHYPWFSSTFKGYPKTVLQGPSACPSPFPSQKTALRPWWRLSHIWSCVNDIPAGCVCCFCLMV